MTASDDGLFQFPTTAKELFGLIEKNLLDRLGVIYLALRMIMRPR